MGKPSRVIVLAEDLRHQRFLRGYLKHLDYSNHDIRFEPLPLGRGSGEQWVRSRYADSVKAFRARSAKAETVLVVIIDADNGDVNRRLQQLQQCLVEADLELRTEGERLVHAVPRRSVETWILCLIGRHVDEATDYSQEHGVDEEITTAADTFFQWTRPNAVPPEHCVSSLTLAIPEARRLE